MNVPQLRFDGFDGNWETKTINDLGTIGRGKSKHRPRNDSRLYGTEYPFVQTSDIKNAGLFLNSYSQAYSEFGLKQSKLWARGTLCITIAANIAETAILEIEACFPDSIIGFTPDAAKTEAIFVKKYFEFINPVLQKLSEGVAQSNLNLEKLASIQFNIPSLSEQQKISSFFSLIEQKIEKQQEKIEKLEQFKKGMMQKIFSLELRFKDENGGEFGEWVFAPISKYIKISSGYAFKSNKFVKEGIPIVRISNIDNKVNFNQGAVYYPETELINSEFIVTKDSLLIAMSGATTGKTGIFKGTNIAYLNQRVGMFIPKENFYYPFVYQLVESPSFKNQLKSMLVTGAQPNISSKQLESIQLHFPTYNEQRKVADYLFALDSKIEKEKEKLMILEEQKKGFMQGMFV